MRVFKSVKRNLIKVLGIKTITVEGLKFSIEKGRVPNNVRRGLLRDTYEDTERNILLGLLKPGMRVLEIGTGIGFISLLAARIVGDQNVFCFEANPSLEQLIRYNYQLNDLHPRLTMKAVTKDGNPVEFFKSENIISSSFYDRKRNDSLVVVESVAMDQIVDDIDPDVLVMDVEGAEIDLLSPLQFKNIRHIIVELHPHIVGDHKIQALIAALERSGFSIVVRDRKTVHFQRFDNV